MILGVIQWSQSIRFWSVCNETGTYLLEICKVDQPHTLIPVIKYGLGIFWMKCIKINFSENVFSVE